MLLIFRLTIHNTLINFIVILIEMRREADDELIEEGAEAVNIRLSIMPLPEQYLGTHVLGRATE